MDLQQISEMQYIWSMIIVIAVTFLKANVIKINMLGKLSSSESKTFGEKVAKNLSYTNNWHQIPTRFG